MNQMPATSEPLRASAAGAPAIAPAIAIVLKGYPRLSETFIAQEIHALEQRGLALTLFSLRHPTDPAVHPVHHRIAAPVTYLPEYLHGEPGRVLRGWRRARRLPGYRQAVRAWRRDLRRDPTRNRVRRFGQACVLAAELPESIRQLHAHFLHTPASVARYAAVMTGLPWSCSAHAKDIWTSPEWEKREKLAELHWLVTCTELGREHLADLSNHPEKVELVYHGLDFSQLPAPPAERPHSDGATPDKAVRLLAVCRLVEKKGMDVLLDGLANLPETLHWRLDHIGGGPLAKALEARAEALGLADRIAWLGPQSQETVFERYRAADLFVLPSRVADDGDRDGLPNVLMEAQSQGLACLSTTVSAIPELIEDGATGVLVPPEDPRALARALATLIARPDRRESLGAAGLRRVRENFAVGAGIDRLMERFGAPAPAAGAALGTTLGAAE